jgi:hypothetical protein
MQVNRDAGRRASSARWVVKVQRIELWELHGVRVWEFGEKFWLAKD